MPTQDGGLIQRGREVYDRRPHSLNVHPIPTSATLATNHFEYFLSRERSLYTRLDFVFSSLATLNVRNCETLGGDLKDLSSYSHPLPPDAGPKTMPVTGMKNLRILNIRPSSCLSACC